MRAALSASAGTTRTAAAPSSIRRGTASAAVTARRPSQRPDRLLLRGVGSWSYSWQQCRLATTTSAPATRPCCGLEHRRHVGHVDDVDRPLLPGGQRHPVEPEGAGHVPDRDAAGVDERRLEGLGLAPVGAGVGDPGGVQCVERAGQARGAVVQGVVGREEQRSYPAPARASTISGWTTQLG